MEDGAYPFLAFSGIPSVSFRFVSDGVSYALQNDFAVLLSFSFFFDVCFT